MRSAKAKTRAGLLAGGNWIIDQVKMIDVYPQREKLANIRGQSQGTGGAPYNVLVGLARAGAPFPLAGAGLVGKDPLGSQILADCRQRNIGVGHLAASTHAPTSYTDVMTEAGRGIELFFMLGANALWTGDDLDFARTSVRIFHLGYLLLLDSLDAPDGKYGTRAARLLARAQSAGLKTSVDVVSEDSDRFARIVRPALPHVDYCILNEFEAGKTTGFSLRKAGGQLDTAALRHAAGTMLQQGVRELVVIHFPEGAFARPRKGEDCWQSSLKLPGKFVAGTAGAGDAFCAGTLLGLHEGWELARCLRAGVCLAAASLADATCTAGIGPLSKALALSKKYGFRPRLDRGD